VSGFNSSGRGTGGWHGESSGIDFARRSPPCGRFEFGRGCSFLS
jgi:hypothetical protein